MRQVTAEQFAIAMREPGGETLVEMQASIENHLMQRERLIVEKRNIVRRLGGDVAGDRFVEPDIDFERTLRAFVDHTRRVIQETDDTFLDPEEMAASWVELYRDGRKLLASLDLSDTSAENPT